MTETESMLTSLLKCRPVDLIIGSNTITVAQKVEFAQMMERRAKGEPLQYILGQCDFMGIPIFVDDRVLIPRPETEILVELAIERAKPLQSNRPLAILDLGTGSGNMAIALAKNIDDCSIIALDISEEALVLAQKNAQFNKVEHKIKFTLSDMGAYLKQSAAKGKKFDIIISNPPYIATSQWAQLPEDVQREPRIALDGGDDGLYYYKMIIRSGYKIVKSNGFLMLEIGDEQSEHVETIFKKYAQYQNVSFHKDYVGTNRIVTAQIAK